MQPEPRYSERPRAPRPAPPCPWWRRSRWIPVALVVSGAIPGVLIGMSLSEVRAQKVKPSPYKKLEVFARVLSYLETEYVDPIHRDRVIEDSIRGLLRGLDPHTQFFSASQVKRLRAVLTGRFSGVGLVVSRRKGQVVVLSAAPGGPAGRAGIRAGDKLLAVDGQSVLQSDLATITTRLRGRRGTRVTLLVHRAGSRHPSRHHLVRDTIRSVDVMQAALPKGLGYIDVRRFSHGVARTALKAFKALRKAHGGRLKGLVLDLRDNPGGLMDEGIRLADQFLEKGLIVRKVGKRGRLRESELAHSKDTLKGFPIAVLINRGTASAAEIVAAALQDHGRATLLGEPSFGKGSMQSIIPLPDGSRLKLTIARYYRPSGHPIQNRGVHPKISVKSPGQGRPIPPSSALRLPGGTEHPPKAIPAWIRSDPVLYRAVRFLAKPDR
ncbi:MAG: S41 family peptidase [bacterium]